MIDLRQSRRNKFKQCEYFSQIKDKNVGKFSELAYQKAPTGFFKASIIGRYEESNQVLENSLMFKKIVVVIETNDDVEKLERNDLVVMDGEKYRADDINRVPVAKQLQFSTRPSYTTTITLKR